MKTAKLHELNFNSKTKAQVYIYFFSSGDIVSRIVLHLKN